MTTMPVGNRWCVRAFVNRVADALADGGAPVERHTPLLPDLTEAATLYTDGQFSAAASFTAAAGGGSSLNSAPWCVR